MNRMRTLLPLAALLFSAVLGAAVLSRPSVVALDYRAFYCAGAALREHRNPYYTASLRDCELNKTDAQYRSRLPTTTLPAPQPLYDIAFFALLSGLPFAAAKAAWGAIIGVSLFVTMTSLVRLTGLSPPLVLAILTTSLIGNTLALGQIVPMYAAAACAAAFLMKCGRPHAAGAAAVVTLIEPHLGLPLCASLAIWSRESRIPLLSGATLLAAVALATGGWHANIEYLTTVLPLHALSELTSDGQLSASVVLHALHASNETALRVGTLSYFAFSAAGVWLARAASTRYSNEAFLVTVPAAAAVMGGSFLHGTDIVAAVPLAMMLSQLPAYGRVSAWALVLLATPWAAQSQPHDLVPWFAFSAAVAACVLWSAGKVTSVASLACAALIFMAVSQVNFAYERDQQVYERQPRAAAVLIDEKYPEASWARVNAGTFATQSAPAWLMRAPTWAGLLLLAGVTGLAVRRPVKVAFA